MRAPDTRAADAWCARHPRAAGMVRLPCSADAVHPPPMGGARDKRCCRAVGTSENSPAFSTTGTPEGIGPASRRACPERSRRGRL